VFWKWLAYGFLYQKQAGKKSGDKCSYQIVFNCQFNIFLPILKACKRQSRRVILLSNITSYSTPSGLGLHRISNHRLLLFYRASPVITFIPPVSPVVTHIEALRAYKFPDRHLYKQLAVTKARRALIPITPGKTR